MKILNFKPSLKHFQRKKNFVHVHVQTFVCAVLHVSLLV